ncbi:DOPA 4,5-dioxygenase [Pleurotus pulmonarius]
MSVHSSVDSSELEKALEDEIKEWHFHIYFHQNNVEEHHDALSLRDAVLRLRRDGAFVAVPLFRVNTSPIGPHPVGSYEIWVPSESFAQVFSYLCMNRGRLSVLVHPLTREERADHEVRNAWIGPSFPLDLSTLPLKSEDIPLQYPSLKLGYSSIRPSLTLEQRRRLGDNVEKLLLNEKYAARAPPRD